MPFRDETQECGLHQQWWQEQNEIGFDLGNGARETAHIELDEPYRAGLDGLERFSHAIVLYWMHQARRDLIVQSPKHSPVPRGVFGLRSPLRPNPVALAVVRLLSIDVSAGRIEIDAIDCLDGTPLLDIKPYLPSVDSVPDATGR